MAFTTMKIKRLKNLRQFIAGDKSLLREILNPRKENLKIRYSLAWAKVKSGDETIPHKLKYSEAYYIIKGQGRISINNVKRIVRKNDTVYIPPNAVQFIKNIGKNDLEFLCIVDPAWQLECERVVE